MLLVYIVEYIGQCEDGVAMHNMYPIYAIKPTVAMTNKAKYHETNGPEILADNVSN